MKYRNIIKITGGEATSDGAGVRLTRYIGISDLPVLDPFLLLDVFRSDDPSAYIAGFPNHPHRGFETVTYLINGRMRHKDHHGHEGLLQHGDMQCMTAGRGIIHSEMPEMEEGLLHGYQLWINLPASKKMMPAAYKDIPAKSIPEISLDNGLVKVLSGNFGGVSGPSTTETKFLYLDVTLEPDGVIEGELNIDDSMGIVIISGTIDRAGESRLDSQITRGQFAVSGEGREWKFQSGSDGARFLLIASSPIRESIARGGPFVMNTREEIIQAYRDYEAGFPDN